MEVLTYTEVDSVDGEAGNFNVTLTKRPKYVDESKCTGCTVCVEYCPIKYPDQFNQEISDNKAIHIYFTQAIPLATYIDESCLYLKEKKCGICQSVCKTGAIDFNQKAEKIEVNVGAIVLALGIEPFDPKLRNDYGYGKFENVVTSLDYERILSPSGAYEGEILRASDKKHPHKIAWIQCVGSRQVNPAGGNSYCSSVCCSYAQKQVILTKEHDIDAECTIFHNDVRSYNKDLERYFQKTEQLPGVRFIRSYVSIGKEIPESKNVTIRYSTPDDGVKEEEFDMVVLSVGLNPPTKYQALADTFGVELNTHGFCKTIPSNPIEATKPGIFVSGGFQGPTDIPESVYSASGAGSQCGELLDYRRGKLSKERIYPPERDVSQEEPKVGVFVCHCGANISRIVSVPSTVEYALSLPNVVYAQEQLFSCATNSAKEIADMAKEKGLNRLVIAACSPRTLEPLFRDTLREAGINQYYLEMANIREHCSWVHAKEKEEATQKAKDLVRMSVARACHLEPLQEFALHVNKTALVVGGGLAGMTSALSVANQGHEVYLIEKDKDLGGMARRIYYTLEGMDVQEYLGDVVRKVYQHPLIHVYTDATITETTGYIGNFETKVKSKARNAEIKHGATILATGAEVYQPTEYLYGEDERVMTHLELEGKIAEGEEKLLNSESLVMIQCVGCRNEDRNYCSRVCCSESIKNALKLKELKPEMDIYILFRDIRTYGLKEDYYREAADKEVRFVRYEQQDQPQVEAGVNEEGRSVLKVSVTDLILGKKLEIDADVLALAAAVIPSEGSQEATQLFKVTTNLDGFFKEAHVKLRPVEFAVDGVYLCGMAHYPKLISETVSQAYGAAGRAITLLSRDSVVASGAVCEVKESSCISCGACITACTYGAIEFVETPEGRKARINPVLCKGDGLCNTKCPTGAIQLKHFTDEEIMSQIDAASGL
ncbi:MAG: heterodisulfide reductase [Desulfosporosinus sp. BRH_c37]|nr:MAG: heterodisulfide reductase [Desulfosporosinus sp. BRH_c37]